MQEIDEIPIEFDHDDVFKSEKKNVQIYIFLYKKERSVTRATDEHTYTQNHRIVEKGDTLIKATHKNQNSLTTAG